MKVGAKIRLQREALGLSLRRTAEAAGISASLVSQIETGKVDPSLNTLRKLALILKTPLFALVLEEGPPAQVVVRVEERRAVNFPDAGLTYRILHSNPHHKMGIHLASLQPGGATSTDFLFHPGEECVVVESGRLRVETQVETFALSRGDSIYFDSSVPHRLLNPGSEECSFWLIISPPRF